MPSSAPLHLKLLVCLTSALLIFFLSDTFANEDDELAAMQKQLNQAVMEKPFSVADEAKIDAYIKDAMARDLKPESNRPKFWKDGYTCRDIYRYGWNHYQNCRYYRRYYGYYW